MKSIVFAGGCFWGVEAYFKQVEGVVFTEVGYANGKTVSPTYKEVCSGKSGHAEAVMIMYNSEIISTKRLLELYFDIIDPTSLNKQGNDIGSQYRTGIYYEHHGQLGIIEKAIFELERTVDKDVVIEVEPIKNFYRAEEYHQNYLDKNPGGYCHIPKEKLNKKISANG